MEIKHIPLEQRKILTAKLILLETRLLLESEFANAGAFSQLNDLVGYILGQIGQKVPELEDNSVPLDAFLKVILNRTNNIAADALGTLFPELFQKFIRTLKQRIEDVSCEKCAAGFPRVCYDGTIDAAIINRGGMCISPLRKMFDLAERATISHYREFASAPDDYEFPKIHFSTDVTLGKPHNFPVEFFVGGTTYFNENSPATDTRVELVININDLDASTYEAILYVLFHECVAHAFHGLIPTVQERIYPTAEDTFSEGWMDWIAFQIMKNVLDGACPHLCQPTGLLRFDVIRDRGQQFHDAKTSTAFTKNDVRSKEEKNNIFKVLSGRRAAERVFKVISKRPRLHDDPWRAFLELSFNLNMMSDFDEDQRNDFVAVLASGLAEDEDFSKKIPEKHPALSGYISQYLIDHDIKFLIYSVCP